ncbi:hypothetical protein FKM82_005639 [Ascaphus truei]
MLDISLQDVEAVGNIQICLLELVYKKLSLLVLGALWLDKYKLGRGLAVIYTLPQTPFIFCAIAVHIQGPNCGILSSMKIGQRRKPSVWMAWLAPVMQSN